MVTKQKFNCHFFFFLLFFLLPLFLVKKNSNNKLNSFMIFELHFMYFYRGFFFFIIRPKGGAIAHFAPPLGTRLVTEAFKFKIFIKSHIIIMYYSTCEYPTIACVLKSIVAKAVSPPKNQAILTH